MSRNLGSLLDDQWVLGGDGTHTHPPTKNTDETLSQIPSTSNLTQHTGGIPDSAHPPASCKVTPSYRPQPSGGEKTTVRKRDKRAPPSSFDPTASSSERGENLNSGAHPGRPLTTFGSGRDGHRPTRHGRPAPVLSAALRFLAVHCAAAAWFPACLGLSTAPQGAHRVVRGLVGAPKLVCTK